MSQYYPSVGMVRFCMFLAILFGLSTVLQASAGNFNSPTSEMVRFCRFLAILFGLSTVLQTADGNINSPTSEWNRTTLQAWKDVRCSYSPLNPLMVFVCLSPDISTVPQVEARPSPVDLLLEDFTALLQRAQRQEQAGVSVFQRLQQHLNDFDSGVGDLQKVLFEAVGRDDAKGIEAAVHLGADLEANKPNQTDALVRKAGAKVSKEEAKDLMWEGVEEDDRLKIEGALQSGADLEEDAGKVQILLWEGIKKDDPEQIVRAHLRGADLNAKRDLDQMTPLGVAARDDRLEAVKTLLRLGAGVDETGGVWNATPLHYASYCGHLKVVIELVASGANVRAKDGDGHTPHRNADEYGHNAVKTYLQAVLSRDYKS